MKDRRAQNIDKRWKGDDGRLKLAELLCVNRTSGAGRKRIDSFLDALKKLVMTRKRTKIVGFGVFEWKRWRNRIPTGERVETWRLAFRPSQYIRTRRKWR